MFGAVAATDALTIIYSRQIVYHFDSLCGAVAHADSATDTARRARIHNFLAAAKGGTSDVNFRRFRDFFHYVFRADRGAFAARDTLFFIDMRHAVNNGHCTRGAFFYARSVA